MSRPGAKVPEFAAFFAGLKPCAPTEKQKQRLFRKLLENRGRGVRETAGEPPHHAQKRRALGDPGKGAGATKVSFSAACVLLRRLDPSSLTTTATSETQALRLVRAALARSAKRFAFETTS